MEKMPWLEYAKHELGQHELAGPKNDNKKILWYFGFTTYKAGHDEVPWCAAFVNACLQSTGYHATHSAAAISFAAASFGEKCEVKPGAILVFEWKPGHYHVTMAYHVYANGTVDCLGGNQSNSVCITNYLKSKIVSCRWPHPEHVAKEA